MFAEQQASRGQLIGTMEAEVEADDEGREGEDPREFALLKEDGSADPYYTVGSLPVDLGEADPLFVASIIITEVSSQLLIAVPAEVWHRTRSKRLIYPDCLSKPVFLEVSAVSVDQRDDLTGQDFVRVWVGLLKPEFESCLHFVDHPIDHPFLTRDGSEGFVPFSEGLVALADDKFTFLSAESGMPAAEAVDPTAKRLSAVEEAIVSMKTSLQQLVQKEALKGAAPKAPEVSKAAPRSKAGDRVVSGLDELDPQVVQSALAAGVEVAHLQQFQKLMNSQKPRLPDVPGPAKVPKKKLDVLGESEEEGEPELIAAMDPVSDPKDPVASALVKLTQIVSVLHSNKKKSRPLEDLFDDSLGAGEASSSSSMSSSSRRHAYVIRALRAALRDSPEELYKVLEGRMLADFGSQEAAPGQGTPQTTFRGWLEHRSKIPNIPSTVRMCWGICGALDSLKQGRSSEAQARLALLLAQMDQLAVDRGQWVLAAEGSLEDPPPFSSFTRHSPPDYLEPQHTKLWPAVWAEAMMFRVRELDDFVEKRSRLGRRGGNQNPQLQNQEEGKKGGGKKDGKKGKDGKGPEGTSAPSQ